MSAEHNIVSIIGNAVEDPELRQVGDSTVAKLRIAANKSFKTKDGEKKQKTLFINVEAWRGTAKVIGDFVKKGKQILVNGTLEMDEWENDAGEKKSAYKISATNIQLLSPPTDS